MAFVQAPGRQFLSPQNSPSDGVSLLLMAVPSGKSSWLIYGENLKVGAAAWERPAMGVTGRLGFGVT